MGFCERPPETYRDWDFEGEPLGRCPRLCVPDWGVEAIVLHRDWSEGRLWRSGGLADQPAWLVGLMREIDGAIGRLEAQRAAEWEEGRRGHR